MSVAVQLIKHLIGNDCIINLLDYSCNSPTIYIAPEETYSSTYYKSDDIEQGNNMRTDYGGNKRNKRTRGKNKGNKRTRGKNKGNKRTRGKK
jgi:hypothetical protein